MTTSPKHHDPNTPTERLSNAPRARIAALLRRKKLRGEEVGKALLWSLISDYEQRDSPSFTQLLSQADLEHMEAALPSAYERARYEEYVQLRNNLLQLFQEAQGQLQQLHHAMFRLTSRVSMAELIWKLDDMLVPISQNTLDPAVAALPHEVHGIFTEDFRALLDRKDLQEELQSGRDKMVHPAYRYLIGYNTTLSLLADGLSLPELCALQIPLESVRSQAEAYDKMVIRCASLLPEADAKAFRRLCPPLALEEIQPHAETVLAFTDKVKTEGPGGLLSSMGPFLVMVHPMEEA